MICIRCGNDNSRFFFSLKGKMICRKCISFNGKDALPISREKGDFHVKLNYSLSKKQQEIASKTAEAVSKGQNVLIHAICGGGKTELVFQAIEETLNRGMNVGFTVPRRDVIIDLYPRFKEAFPSFKIALVYGGHNEELEGDIVLLTTHQLYRYHRYFDLLIIDETDAFPYYGDETLEYFFKISLKRSYIMLTATPLDNMIKMIKDTNGLYLTLFQRYHNHIHPIPEFVIRPFILKYGLYDLAKEFIVSKLPFLIFVPTIIDCEEVFKFIHRFFKQGDYVHSKREERERIINDFKQGKYDYLVTTSVLERGVTIKNLQVIVYKANHNIFTKASLIQIGGRVGRKIDAYDGKIYFLAEYISCEMEQARQEIITYNNSLRNL